MTDPYRYTRKDARLEIMASALSRLVPGGTPAFITIHVTETFPDGRPGRTSWSGTPDGLAMKLFTALHGRPDKPLPAAPLVQADEAERARDLVGMVDALKTGYDALHGASWYPARAGDLVHVAYEAAGDMRAFGETYLVERCPDDTAWLQLRLLHHTATEADYTGAFAPGVLDDPLIEPWMEAGPHRLTIVRKGVAVHSPSTTAAPVDGEATH